jgi:4-amino-4-deoxy-L-arabinose transferase-like glycosyltransferase
VTNVTSSRGSAFPWGALGLVLAVALVGRVLLLASGAVSFHSDEAVIGLMARHILDGERPVFFYGQAYMGSLDAWLVALGFRLLGDTVPTIRVVQAVLYLGVVASTFLVGWRLSGRQVVASVAALTLAVPPVLLAVYTTATLGGYNETLLFGNLLLALGYDITHEHRRSWWRWALLGLVGGLAWWTNGLVVAFAAPVALLVFWRILRPVAGETRPLLQRAAPLLVTVVFFFIGSAPWWVFNLENDWAALSFYIARSSESQFAGNDVPSLPLDQRLLGVFFLGFPTLIGLRFPWEPSYFIPVAGALLVFIYGLALFRLARRTRAYDGASPLKPDAALLLLGMTGIFLLIFFVSKFSIDPTGRYFLPFAIPFGVALGALVVTLRRQWLRVGIVALVIGYFAVGQAVAVSREPGLTTQFNLDSHIPHDYDDALIAFLDEHELYAGYTTYWVAFRLAFLTDERMQYSSALPYKPSLSYTEADERYPAYKVAADAAANPAYITARVVEVQQRLEEIFAEMGVTYQREEIGPYTVYYDFAPEAPRPPLPLAQ